MLTSLLQPTLVAAAVCALALVRAYRPLDDDLVLEWAQAHGLELSPENGPVVRWYLRTARVLRTWGAVAGAVLPPLAELAWSGRGRVLGASADGFQPGDVSWIFVGYLVGAMYAELALVRPAPEGRRSASLMPRDLRDYLPGGLLWAQRAAGAAGVVGALAIGAAPCPNCASEPAWPFVVGVALYFGVFAFGLERMERWLVQRPQPFVAPSLVAADDAIRSQSVHSVAGSGLAVLLFTCSGLALGLAASGGRILAWTMGLLAVPLLLLSLVSCQYYGQRAWRVRRPAAGAPGGAPA